MKECYDLGINKDYLKGIIASFEKCSDKRSISSFRSRHNSLIPKMRQSLYNYYSKRNYQVIEDERRFSESEWFEWMYESCFFSVPLFELYKPSTPINFHLNKFSIQLIQIFRLGIHGHFELAGGFIHQINGFIQILSGVFLVFLCQFISLVVLTMKRVWFRHNGHLLFCLVEYN